MAKIALLIGVSDYTSGFAPLPSAVKDAQAMQGVLEHSDIGGFDRVQRLENPDRQSMEDAIEALFTSCRKDDLVLLFFSGHGVKDDGGGLYLAAHNARKDERGRLVKSRAVAAGLVVQFMENCKSKRQVIILDCCFSGAFAEGMKVKDDGSVDVKNQLGGEGRVILTSSTAMQYSFEQPDSDLSIYTQHLVEGIQTGDADQDRDGFIGVNELHDYAKRRVQEIKPEMNPEIYLAKEGYNKILLAQTPSIDPVLRYSQEVQQLAHGWEIRFKERTVLDQVQDWLNLPPRDDVQMSSTRRKALDALRHKLRLSQEVASQREAEVLQPYREFHQKIADYKREFAGKIRWGKPLTNSDRRELKDLQRALNLKNETAAYAEREISQRRQRFPYSSIQTFYRLLNPTTFVLLFGSAILIFLAIDVFKAVQERFEMNQQPSTFPTESSVFPSSDASPDAQNKFQEAQNKVDEGKYQEAIDLYKSAIKINPQISDYYAGLGIAYYKLAGQYMIPDSFSGNSWSNENFRLAIKNLEKAIELKDLNLYSNNVSVYKIHIFLGHAYTGLDKKQNASKAYNAYSSAIQENPTEKNLLATAYEGRAAARMRWKYDRDGAKADYGKARRLYEETNTDGKNSEAIKRVNNALMEMQ